MNVDEKIDKLFIDKITTGPGVYQFYNSLGEILYIGKAKNLRSRVKSYFLRAEELKNNRSEAIYQMVFQVRRIKVIELDSEIESLLFESELVNKLKPKYNSRLKDDKSFYLISICKSKPQKITLVRSKNVNIRDKNYLYFGPYLSGDLLKKSLRFLRKIFPYPDCSNAKYFRQRKVGRGCLYFDLGLCLAPCQNQNFQQSDQQIKYLINFLSGRKRQLIKYLRQRMKQLSEKRRYEQATKIRDQIVALERLNRYPIGIRDSFSDFQSQTFFSRIEAYDVSNIGGNYSVGAMTVATLGKVDKSEYKKFKIKFKNQKNAANDIEAMKELINRRIKNSWPRPNLIVIDGGLTHQKAVKSVLESAKIDLPIISIAKGRDRKKDEFHYSSSDLAKYFQHNQAMKNLVIELRDESHRFAIEYYRKVHRKDLIRINENNQIN